MIDLDTSPAFLRCLPLVLASEGGNDDDPHDSGGRTSRGITQREYNAWLEHQGVIGAHDVWRATDGEIAKIYYLQYWLPHCAICPPGVDYVLFDMNVNTGPRQAALLLQRALGVTDDGHIGLVTLAALKAVADQDHTENLIAIISDERWHFYRALRGYRYFGSGWINRVRRSEHDAMKMVTTEDTSNADTAAFRPADTAAFRPADTAAFRPAEPVAAPATVLADETGWE